MSQVSSNDTFDREVYKTQKREEKDRIFEMLSEETQALLDPEKLKAYADVQARFLRSSVSNALLIGRQRPEATWIRSFDDWKNEKKAGFDAVQLHFAHGYLLSEVISPATNHRKDKWGGTEEKRFYIADRIISGIRKELPDYPILVKMHGDDRVRNGIHSEESVRIAKRMEQAGVSAIEVSCGLSIMNSMGPLYGKIPAEMILSWYPQMMELPGFMKKMMKPILPKFMKEKDPAPRRYNVPEAKAIKAAVNIPVIVVGGIHDLPEIEQTVTEDGIDFVSMARPLVLEPGLIGKYKAQKAQQARCLECNHCIIGISQGKLQCWYGKVPAEIK